MDGAAHRLKSTYTEPRPYPPPARRSFLLLRPNDDAVAAVYRFYLYFSHILSPSRAVLSCCVAHLPLPTSTLLAARSTVDPTAIPFSITYIHSIPTLQPQKSSSSFALYCSSEPVDFCAFAFRRLDTAPSCGQRSNPEPNTRLLALTYEIRLIPAHNSTTFALRTLCFIASRMTKRRHPHPTPTVCPTRPAF